MKRVQLTPSWSVEKQVCNNIDRPHCTIKQKLTCAKMSFMVSEASGSPCPRILSNLRILTCKNGSEIPFTSCSGEQPLIIRFFKIRTRFGTIFLKCAKVSGDLSAISVIKTMPVTRTSEYMDRTLKLPNTQQGGLKNPYSFSDTQYFLDFFYEIIFLCTVRAPL